MRGPLAIILFAGLLSLAAEGQSSLSQWYSTAPEARSYDSIREELESVEREAVGRSIPQELIVARVLEGAGKRIQPPKLLAAIKQDLVLYGNVAAALEKRGKRDGSAADEVSFLSKGAMALRSGISSSSLNAVLALAPSASTGRTLDALVAVGAILPRMAMEPLDAESLALALTLGAEPAGKFSMLSSLFLRGRAGGLAVHDLVTMAVTVMGGGGTFLQLENEISRRIK